MAMYSSTDGLIDDFHLAHLGARAMGGAGLVFAEMTCVSPDARITPGCLGLWNDEQEAQWKRLVDLIHGVGDAKAGMQLGHAGRKGSTKVAWEGIDQPLETGGWGLISASAAALPAGLADPESHDAGRHGPGARRLCRCDAARGGGWMRLARASLRAWLSSLELPLASHERAQ